MSQLVSQYLEVCACFGLAGSLQTWFDGLLLDLAEDLLSVLKIDGRKEHFVYVFKHLFLLLDPTFIGNQAHEWHIDDEAFRSRLLLANR